MARRIYTLFAILMVLGSSAWSQGYMHNLRLAPLSLFTGGTGAGISYEAFTDESRRVSVVLPLQFGLRNSSIGNNMTATQEQNYSVMIAPGVRLYPMGKSTLSYVIGASLFATYGRDNGYASGGSSSFVAYAERREMRWGSVVSNSLTLDLSPRINIGLELLYGYSFQSRFKNKQNDMNTVEGVKEMLSLNFQVGYRF